ncbi:hypothetical protein M436DRAFT_66384 [Aureobasidium namibiae CBS 147.97]|uniref:Uncharacterized protein n=1 Tax=Aureobasidium namibiae CBS 147.97 TaxID=1043004 RepID=A0A074X787_9PEZI|nr:uncharacterized protein M436DRAFT_66384 [Aureobasidium namibiae CBS 147.97]KEQ70476.1 hypothetical protein M436DRAFT_66384 [Aureobasidium namibiae CBS 147.97]
MAEAKMTDMANAKMPDIMNNPIDEVVKHAITNSVMDIICNVVDIMVETNSPMPVLKKTMTKDLMTSINARVEALVDEHVNQSLEAARTKAALEAELEMAKKLSAIRAAIVKDLEDHLELRSRQFEDFSGLLESTAIDAGEDGLGAAGVHTTNLNIACIIHEKDDEVLKQTVKYLEADLPGNAEICEIQADIAKMDAKLGIVKEEGTVNAPNLHMTFIAPAVLSYQKNQDWRDGLASVFINREGRDPTLAEIQLEYDKAWVAERREFDMTAYRLLKETGIEPNKYEILDALELQMKNPEYNSEYAVYHRWDQNPSYPANSKLPTSRSNPIDLTNSDQSATNTATKKHETDLRQTNAGAVRSFAPHSTLNLSSLPKQESIFEHIPLQPIDPSSEIHPETSFSTQMLEVGRRKIKAVPKGTATSTPNSRDAGPTTEAAARNTTNTTVEASSQPLTKKHTEKISNAGRAMQSKSSPPPASTRIEYDRPLFVKAKPRFASSTDRSHISGPIFVRKQPNGFVLVDDHEQLDSTPEFNDKSPFRALQPHPGSASSQQPARAPISSQASNDGVTTVLASQYSEHFDDYIKEKLGQGVDGRTHRIFKLAMLHASRWTLENMPRTDGAIQVLSSQVTTNERNSRTVNKCVETVLDACDVKDDSKPADLYKLLDKQEKERQQSLERVADKLNKEKKDKVKLMSELEVMKEEVQKEKDARDQEDEDRLRKHLERKKKGSKEDGGNSGANEERRKRRRDAEQEEHVDIDMLL